MLPTFWIPPHNLFSPLYMVLMVMLAVIWFPRLNLYSPHFMAIMHNFF